MMHVGSFVQHAHCPTQSSIKMGNLRLIVWQDRSHFLVAEKSMRISVDCCGIAGWNLLRNYALSLKNFIDSCHVFVNAISTHKDHVTYGFYYPVAMSWVCQICVPVYFMFAWVRRYHLADSRGYSNPQISVELGSSTCLERDLLHL